MKKKIRDLTLEEVKRLFALICDHFKDNKKLNFEYEPFPVCPQGERLSCFTKKKNGKHDKWLFNIIFMDNRTKEIEERYYYKGRHWFNVYKRDNKYSLTNGQYFGLYGLELLNEAIDLIKPYLEVEIEIDE